MQHATTERTEILVSRAVAQDKVDRAWQAAVSKAKRGLKKAPGGRRAWIWYQAVFGAYNPHRAICEFIDMLVDSDAPEEDAEAIAFFFVSYMHARYASKEVRQPCVREALRLESHTDADADKVQADAMLEDSPTNLVRVIEVTGKEVRAGQLLLDACRRKLGIVS
jgi:hypothetical protein